MSKETAENILVINAGDTQTEYIKDLFRYREMLMFLAWRDILVRYKQAFFGISWALLRPLLHMALFAFLFGKIAHLPSHGVNYSLFVLAAMLPWHLCSNASVDTCNSLVNYAHLMSKIYFPRIIIPLAQIIIHLMDFTIGLVLLIGLTYFFEGSLHQVILFLPFFILLAIVLCIGLGLWLSACTVKYRDFRIIVPFFIQFGMFLSPVGYATDVIPGHWQWAFFLNPMVGIIEGFRWTLFGIMSPYLFFSVMYSVVIASLFFIFGFRYFRRMERSFADRI